MGKTDSTADHKGGAASGHTPWEQFEFYLRIASNYGLAIFLVLYYVLVMQPREAGRLDPIKTELKDIKSELQDIKGKNKEMADNLSRLENQSSRQLTDMSNLIREMPRPEVPTSIDLPANRMAALRQRVVDAFQEHLLDSLVFNTHSRQYFPDEVRYALCEEFRRGTPFDLRAALLTGDEGKANEFGAECKKLSEFLFEKYGNEYQLTGNGKPVSKGDELRLNARPHVQKQGDRLLFLAWQMVGK
jgi:hypothetical protein